MSVQLIVYPQSYEGSYNVISSSSTEFIVNGINFNALGTTATYSSSSATPFIDTFINAPAFITNTWFRFISTTGGTPAFASVTAANLVLNSVAGSGSEAGVYQRLSNLTIGVDYIIEVNIVAGSSGNISMVVANGSTQYGILTTSANTTQATFQFNAQSTDTTVMIAYGNTVATFLTITSISVQPLVGADPSGAIQLLGDGQVICDLYEDEDLPLTLSVDNFKNVAEKVQSYSKAFNLPATKRNNKIFDQMFEITRSADGVIFNPYKKTQCILKQDGFIIFEGFLRMLDVTDKEGEISYNVNLYSEVVAFADTLQDRTFRDLDFTELEHLYNYTNIKLSYTNATSVAYTNTETSGFRDNNTLKYPFGDWEHQYTVDASGYPELPSLESTFRPFINIKYLIDRIFQATTFTYESAFFNTNDFKNLFMDFNWGANQNPNTNTNTGYGKIFANATPDIYATNAYTNFQYLDISMPSESGFDASTNIFTCPAGQTNSSFIMVYNTPVIAKRDADIEFRWVKNRLTVPQIFDQTPPIPLQGSAVVLWSGTIGGLFPTFTANILDGGYYTVPPTITLPSFAGSGAVFTAVLTGNTITSITVVGGSGYSFTDELIFNGIDPVYNHMGAVTVPMEPGDTLELQFKASNTNYIRQDNSPFNNSTSTLFSKGQLTANVTVMGITREALLQNLRGDLGQWEFLKGLITMFNLVTLPDEDNPNNIKIEPYTDVFIPTVAAGTTLADRGIQHDWTDKIDISEIKLTPLTDLNRKTIFKFVEDDDDYAFNQYKNLVGGHLYGSKKYNAGNEFNILEGTDEIVAEPFAATVVKPLMTQYTDLIIPSLYSYSANDDTTEGFDNSPRIMFNNGVNILSSTTFNVPAQNGVSGNATENEFLQFSHFSTIPGNSTSLDFNFGECQTLTGVGSTLQNLFNLYWLPYYSELYNPNTRTMIIKVNLSPSDINRFRFNDTVFIKNRVFRVNKINYKPNDLATVEFILIP
tara:strand:+ start:2261 stop:5218 length:2958 start_codon:yes stop_codon:yes gene_type:complete